MGFEKTFLDERWSVELRMPFFGKTEFDSQLLNFHDDHVGNLAIILKRLVYRSDDLAACIGLGIDTPTGSNVYGRAIGTDFTIHNDAVHLMPYTGFLYTPNRFFCQGFLQLDVAANGDRIDSHDPIFSLTGSDVYNEQTLLYSDIQVGYWLYRNRCARLLTGLAPLVEFHYTSTLQNTDVTPLVAPVPFTIQVTNPANRVDMVNMTTGVHAEFARHTFCRVAGVFPLSQQDNRAFDGELQIQLERRF